MTGPVDLTRYARRKTVELTTIGRRSGEPRRVKIWFFVGGPDHIFVQHVARKPAQWYRNLTANPQVYFDLGDGQFAGRAQPIEKPSEIAAVLTKIGSKYWTHRLIRLFSGGGDTAVAARIDLA